MAPKSLAELYDEHQGKVSDKWSIYLNEYDRLFGELRYSPVSLLEIGIQNGGSLEIWAQYFPSATKIVGCDINPDCGLLQYDDPRIAVVIGDVNTDTTQADIVQQAQVFHVIIDDGSHLSSDIIKSFARYFPYLEAGGLFVVEDLHCSYWQEYEGGLFDPFSSIAFFKRLADIVSYEHWGLQKQCTDTLEGFFSRYAFQMQAETLLQVHSVEFLNSLCIIRKARPEANRLGTRIIAGSEEKVISGHLVLQGGKASPAQSLDQTGTLWAVYSRPLDEEFLLQRQEIAEREAQIGNLTQSLVAYKGHIAELTHTLQKREVRIADLTHTLQEREAHLANVTQTLQEHEAHLAHVTHTLQEREAHLASLAQTLQEHEAHLAHVTHTLQEREAHLASLTQTLQEHEAHLATLRQTLVGYQHSRSWRLTSPLRFIGRQYRRSKRILRLLRLSLSRRHEIHRAFQRARHLYAREGLHGLERRLHALQSQPALVLTRYGGLSPEFVSVLTRVAAGLVHSQRWWFASPVRTRLSEQLGDFWRGQTEAARHLTLGPFRFHLDRPRIGLLNIVQDACVVSGWAVNLATSTAAKVRIVTGNTLHTPHSKPREDVQQAFHAGSNLLDVGFTSVLTLPVGLHRMRVDLQMGDGTWQPMRRAVLLRLPGLNVAKQIKPALSYQAWTRLVQKRLQAEEPEIRRHIAVMLYKPVFTIVIITRQGTRGLTQTWRSLQQQYYRCDDIRVLPESGTEATWSLPPGVRMLRDTSLADIQGDFLVCIAGGQRLARHALYEFASALNQDPHLDLLYGDEDVRMVSGKHTHPFYKPTWSPDYLETWNYIGFPACFRTALARGCFDQAHMYDLVLRFTERTTRVRHIAKVLGHATEYEGASPQTAALDIAALSGRLHRTGRQGTVYEHPLHPGCYLIRLALTRTPLVSVIIPTAGKTVSLGERQIDLLENVIDHIRHRSTYKNLEIIVVDNGDLSPAQQRMLVVTRCQQITYTEPVFNIAKKLNLGASLARGELLLLMNDDIEILTPDWIERLLEHFEKPHVGVVGAKLLYPDERTQHVGVVHNAGNPDHVRRLFPRNDAGYFFSTCGVRNYAAVTGACMMTPARLYREVGGYSEELAVSYNDVDYCLKVRQKGFWVVYAPGAELIHMESQSRVASADLDEVAWYHKRWAAEIVEDAYYNERFLTVASPTFVPCVNQRML